VLEVNEGEAVSWVRMTMRWAMGTATVLELGGGGGFCLRTFFNFFGIITTCTPMYSAPGLAKSRADISRGFKFFWHYNDLYSYVQCSWLSQEQGRY
jgi:hypothetical protein